MTTTRTPRRPVGGGGAGRGAPRRRRPATRRPRGRRRPGRRHRVGTTDVPLPEGYEPVVVVAWGKDLLVGLPRARGFGLAPAAHRAGPRAAPPRSPSRRCRRRRSRRSGSSPRRGEPRSTSSVVRRPARTRTPGGAPGAGDASAVRELPQPFATFGGWGAGALVSLVQTPSAPVVVGSWESGGAGLDIALWHPEGERWVRASSAGTALASTATDLVSARGATADREGLLVVGSVTLLGEGSVTQRAAVWRAPGPDGPWTRTDLPGDGALGEAHAAACDAGGTCTVVGVVDGTLRGWTLRPEGAPGILALPALAVGEHDLLTAPLLGGCRGDRRAGVRRHAARADDGRRRRSPGPTGRPHAWCGRPRSYARCRRRDLRRPRGPSRHGTAGAAGHALTAHRPDRLGYRLRCTERSTYEAVAEAQVLDLERPGSRDRAYRLGGAPTVTYEAVAEASAGAALPRHRRPRAAQAQATPMTTPSAASTAYATS